MMRLTAVQSPTRRRLRILRRPSESIRPSTPRPQRRDCQGRLISALLVLAGPQARLVDAGFRPWCSATFIGAQHQLTIALSGPDARERAAALSESLPEAELSLPNHIVADLVIDAVQPATDGEIEINLAVLTIEDW